jgi:hypothetical protein
MNREHLADRTTFAKYVNRLYVITRGPANCVVMICVAHVQHQAGRIFECVSDTFGRIGYSASLRVERFDNAPIT